MVRTSVKYILWVNVFVCRLIELTSKHRVDQDREMERLKSAQRTAEKTLDSREKAHRDRVRTLESQVRI